MSRWDSYCCLLLFCCWGFFSIAASAQVTYRVQHQPPGPVAKGDTVNLRFDLPGLDISRVQESLLFYRYDGDISYRQMNVNYSGGMFLAPLKVDRTTAGRLEYYFQVTLNNGESVYYPSNYGSLQEPVTVDLVEPAKVSPDEGVTADGISFTILSPEPGEALYAGDVLIAITLFYEEGAVDTSRASFHLLLDGKDVTEDAEASPYFFSYLPGDLSPGRHRVKLLLEQADGRVEIADWAFTVRGPDGEITEDVREPVSVISEWIPEGRVELAARNQVIAGDKNGALRGNFRVNGRKDNIRYSAYGLFTSQESARLQPQNRFGAEVLVGDWLELEAGHFYPTISDLTIAGRRVLGLNTTVHLWDDFFQFRFMFGRINRSISNLYNPVNSNVVNVDGIPVDTTYALPFSDGGSGTFKRNVVGGSIGIGRGRTARGRINILKVQDDTSSINLVRDFDELIATRPDLAGSLDEEERADLLTNPGLLNVDGNPVPKGNLVASTDVEVNLFNNRVQFRSETGASLLNNDISGGPLTGDNDLGVDVDSDIENFLDKISWLIIINENMNTLPFRVDVTGDVTNLDPFFPTGILGSESELSLNYFDHNLRLQYRWVGPEYTSLANSTIRTDVAGITLSDRFRLLEDQLYVTLGYEDLKDNLTGKKEATTDTRTVRTNLSWYPVQRNLPRISLGVMYRNRDNGVGLNNPFITSGLETSAVRNFEITGGDTLLAAGPRLTKTIQINTSITKQFELFDITHDASLNYSFLNTKDEVFAFGGTDNNTLSLLLNSRLKSIPLDTNIGFNINSTETLGGLSKTDIVGFSIGGTLLLMDGKLDINGDIAFTRNSTETGSLEVNDNGTPNLTGDDFFQPGTDTDGNEIITETKSNLYIFRAGAQYRINSNNAIYLDLSFTNVADKLGNIDTSNDQVIQARYIYNF